MAHYVAQSWLTSLPRATKARPLLRRPQATPCGCVSSESTDPGRLDPGRRNQASESGVTVGLLCCCCPAVLLLSCCAAAVLRLLCCCCAAVLLLPCCAAAEHRDVSHVTESTTQATEARGPTPDVSTPDSESEPGSASLRVSQQRALSQRGVWHPPNLKRQPEDRCIIGPRRKAARRKRQAAEEALRSTRK